MLRDPICAFQILQKFAQIVRCNTSGFKHQGFAPQQPNIAARHMRVCQNRKERFDRAATAREQRLLADLSS
jgi:hypothetical protein